MNLALLRLSARRAAPAVALLGVAAITLLAAAGQPGRAEIVEVSPRFEEVIVSAGELAASTALPQPRSSLPSFAALGRSERQPHDAVMLSPLSVQKPV